MSFILDALRKSEIERQRQSGPGIAELPIAREDRRLPIALLAIGLLLAVNVGVVLFFLLRDDDGRAPAAASAAVTPAAATSAPTAAMATPERVAATGAGTPAPEAPETEPASVPFEPATLPPDAPDPTLLPEAPLAQPGARVTYTQAPPAENLPSAPEVGLPDMTVDLHIYTDDPAKRAVFINGRRYTQGATTAEGAVVEEITRDGAVLSHRGRRFLLPRL